MLRRLRTGQPCEVTSKDLQGRLCLNSVDVQRGKHSVCRLTDFWWQYWKNLFVESLWQLLIISVSGKQLRLQPSSCLS